MEGSKGFAEIWAEAHRERSEYVWSIISRLMATPRRPAPQQSAQKVEQGEISHPAPVTVTNR
jgi:hypothetical protein